MPLFSVYALEKTTLNSDKFKFFEIGSFSPQAVKSELGTVPSPHPIHIVDPAVELTPFGPQDEHSCSFPNFLVPAGHGSEIGGWFIRYYNPFDNSANYFLPYEYNYSLLS